MLSEKLTRTLDVIREAEKEGTSDQWAWVSELSKCHCYSDLWKHTENNPHCTCNLHSKVSMEKHDTKGSNPVTGQGQARVREGGTDTSRSPPTHITPSFPHFLLPCRLLMTLQNKEMQCVIALTISPWPDVCIWSNYYWPSLPGVYDIKTKLIGLAEHYPPCHHSPSIKLWFESLARSPLLSPRVRTRGELWRENKTVCLGLLFYLWWLSVCLRFVLLLRTPDQALTSGCQARGVSDKVAEGKGRKTLCSQKPLSWLLTRCPAGILPTASAVFQCQPLAWQ